MEKVMTNSTEELLHERLQQFIDGWNGNLELFDRCLIEEPYLEFSMFGYMYSTEMLKTYIAHQNPGTDLHVQMINYSAVINGNEARQYATVIGLFTNAKRHLAFGGTFVTRAVKSDADWKLHTVRFNLQCEDSVGRTSLSKEGSLIRVSGFGDKTLIKNWKAIDDRIGHNMSAIPNMGDRMISPDYDTPWYAIPDQENTGDDTQQLKDLLYKYCYGFDLATFPVVCDVLHDNAKLQVEGETFTNKRDIIGYLKLLRKTKPRSFHAVVFENIHIDADQAALKALRIAPDLKTARKVSGRLEQWIDGVFEISAVKQDGRWLMTKLAYRETEGQK